MSETSKYANAYPDAANASTSMSETSKFANTYPDAPNPGPDAPPAYPAGIVTPYYDVKAAAREEESHRTDPQMTLQYLPELPSGCATGNHQPKRTFGALGVVSAIALFPIGLVGLMADSEKVCERCGAKLSRR
ncbi:hypothetical protein L208DRAFT_1402477 [Tricholoma matsutake]|nr:hypothetical protein L208DRAFT_1402477 [Tricholoma matsutake 945]